MSRAWEFNFDGIVGPTYNYAGLSYGNLASMHSGGMPSNPRQAALEGLSKMRLLMELGIKQAVLPPQERPHLATLRQLGFRGADKEMLAQAYQSAPELLAAVCSASSMWVANAATVSPSVDASDGKIHFTPANLISNLHRSLEPSETARMVQILFRNENGVVVHAPLPSGLALCDEGAANHMRLCSSHGSPGLQVFAFGRNGLGTGPDAPTPNTPAHFPARQTRQASQAVARLHRLSPDRTMFVRQHPRLIDLGVFHNDVICVANETVLFCHALAFENGQAVIDELHHRFRDCCGCDLIAIIITPEELSAEEAVATYLFNSQIVTLPGGDMALIAPTECKENPRTRNIIERVLADETNPIRFVRYVNIRQSMRNGGGPACLRLRVVLTDEEMASLHPGVVLTPELYESLCKWVYRHYRNHLVLSDLADPAFLDEAHEALDEITEILGLGSIYGFQRALRLSDGIGRT